MIDSTSKPRGSTSWYKRPTRKNTQIPLRHGANRLPAPVRSIGSGNSSSRARRMSKESCDAASAVTISSTIELFRGRPSNDTTPATSAPKGGAARLVQEKHGDDVDMRGDRISTYGFVGDEPGQERFLGFDPACRSGRRSNPGGMGCEDVLAENQIIDIDRRTRAERSDSMEWRSESFLGCIFVYVDTQCSLLSLFIILAINVFSR